MSLHAVGQVFNHPASQVSMLSVAGLAAFHALPVLAAIMPIIYYGLSAVFLVIDRFKPKKDDDDVRHDQ